MARIAYAFLLLFIFSIPWEELILIPGLGTMTRLLGLVAFPLCLIAIVQNGRAYFHWPVVLLVLFVALAALSLLWTPNPDDATIRLRTYVQLLALVWVTTQILDSEDKLHGVFIAYIFGSYVAAMGAIQAYMTGSYEKYLRYAAEDTDPNDLALGLAIAIAMAGFLAVRRRGWWRLLSLIYLPIGFYGILLSASRAGFLAALLAGALPLMLLVRPRHYAKAAVCAIAVFAVGVVLVLRFAPESSLERISTIDTELSEGTLNGRLAIWAGGLDVLSQSPVLGVGIGGFGDAMLNQHGLDSAAHNGFLAIAVEQGIVGLLIVMLVWGLVARDVAHMPSNERQTWLVILAVLFIAIMSLNWEWQKQTWLLLALALGHARCIRAPLNVHRRASPTVRRVSPLGEWRGLEAGARLTGPDKPGWAPRELS